MPKIARIFILVIIGLVLYSCSKRQLNIKEIKSSLTGIITLSLNMTTLTDSNIDENQVLLVCFSEIKENKLVGISCQNDTGFHLFSGGLKKGRFELEKVSRFILKIRPITILNYVKLSLFSEYMIINKFNYKIKINKSQKHTVIKDYNKKLNIEIDVL